MANQYAQIIDNKVAQVIVAHSIAWCNDALGGTWILDDGTAGIGYTYANGVFTAPQPYPSWTLVNNVWTAPTPMPTDGMYQWNETTKTWVAALV